MKRILLVMFFMLALLLSASSISPYYAEEEAPTPAISGETGTPTALLETPMPTPTLDDAPALALTAKSGDDLSLENNSDAALSGRDYFYLSGWPAAVIYSGQKVVFTCSGMPRKGWRLIGLVGDAQCYENEITQKGSFSITINVSGELSKAAGKVIRFYAYDLNDMGQQNGPSYFLCASLMTTEISVSAPDEIYTGEVFEGLTTPYAFVTVSIPGKYNRTMQAGADGVYAAECPQNALAGEVLSISADNGFAPPAVTSVQLSSREGGENDGLSIVKWPKRYYSAEDPTLRMVGARKAGEKVFVTLEAEDTAAFTLDAQDYGEDHWIFEANASDLARRLGIALGAVSIRAHYAKAMDGPGCAFFYRLRQNLGSASNRYLGSPIYGNVRPGTPISITIRRPLAGGTYQIIDWAEVVSGPTAQYVLSGYSQSAQIGDQILIQIADNDLVFGDDRIDTFVAPKETTDPGVPVIIGWNGSTLYRDSMFSIEGTGPSSTYVFCQITAPGVDPYTISTRSNSDGEWGFYDPRLPGDTVDGVYMGIFNAYVNNDITFTLKFGGLNARSVTLSGHVYDRFYFEAPARYVVGDPITFETINFLSPKVQILRDGAIFTTITPAYSSDGRYSIPFPAGVEAGDIARISLTDDLSESHNVKFVEVGGPVAPVTVDWPEAATLGRYDLLTISGTAEPGCDVRLFLSTQGELKEFVARADASGRFQKTLYAANDLIPFRDKTFTLSAGYWNGTTGPSPTYDYRYTAALYVPRVIPASGVITGTVEAQATVGLDIRGADGILLHRLTPPPTCRARSALIGLRTRRRDSA